MPYNRNAYVWPALLRGNEFNLEEFRPELAGHKQSIVVGIIGDPVEDIDFFVPVLWRQESFHIIEGLAYVVLFTEDGQVDEIVRLGEHHSGENFYCRIPEGAYHSVLVASDWLVFHETTKGPFRREDSAFAPWAPAEEDTGAMRKFLDTLWDQTGVDVDPNRTEIE